MSSSMNRDKRLPLSWAQLLPAPGHSLHCSSGREVCGSFPQLESTSLVLPKHLNCSFCLCLVWCRMQSLAGCLLFRRVPRKAQCLGDIIWQTSRRKQHAGGGVSLPGSGSFLLCMVIFFNGEHCCPVQYVITKGASGWRRIHLQRCLWSNKWHLPWGDEKSCPGTRTYSARNPVNFPELFLVSVSWTHFTGWSPWFTPVQRDWSHDGGSGWTFAHKAQMWTQESTRHKPAEVHPLWLVAIIYDFCSCLSSRALQSDIFFLCPLFYLFSRHPKQFSQSVLCFSSVTTRLVKQNDLR